MNNPKVTLALLSYNHERFIEEAIKSCLNQNYDNLEIFYSDDHSTDKTYQIASNIIDSYDGKHNIVKNKTERNIYLDHLPAIYDRFSGDIIVLACGDDIQHPNRVSKIVSMWQETNASVFCSSARIIDENGVTTGMHRLYQEKPDLSLDYLLANLDNATCFGAGLAWTKDITDTFGPLGKGQRNIDFSFPFRGLLLNGAAFCNQPLLDWRQHNNNSTLAIKHKKAKEDIEKLLIKERFFLNRIANLHSMIEDANNISLIDKNEKAFNMIVECFLKNTLEFVSNWRAVRHQLDQAKIGIY